MTTLASIDAGRVATTSYQAVAYERRLGVRAAVALLVHPFATRRDVLVVLLASVERQARLSGCGRDLHLEVPDAE